MPPELRIRQVRNLAQSGDLHLRIGKVLMHILDRLFNGKERGGLVGGRALLLQMAENGVEQRHALMVIAGAFAIPRIVDRSERIHQHRRVLQREQLRRKGFRRRNVQIDTEHFLRLGLNMVGAACGKKEYRAGNSVHGSTLITNGSLAPGAEGECAVLPRGDNAVLCEELQFDHG